MLIEEYYNIHSTEDDIQIQPLTYQESNVVRYIAGNVTYKIRTKIIKDEHPLKDKLLVAIDDLKKEENTPSSSSSTE